MVSPESLALIWLPEIDWSLFARFIIELAAEFTGLLDFVRLILTQLLSTRRFSDAFYHSLG